VRYLLHRIAAAGRAADRVLALGARTTRACSTWPTWAALAQRANGSPSCTARCRGRCFGGLWGGFDTDEVPIGLGHNGVHGHTWAAASRRAAREPGLRAPARRRRCATCPRYPPGPCGSCAPTCGCGWSRRSAAGPGGPGWSAVRSAPGAGLDRLGVRPGPCSPSASPGRVPTVKPAHPDDCATRPVARPAARPGAPGAARGGRPSRTRPTMRQGADPADRALLRRPAVRHRIVFLPDYDMSDGPVPVLGLRRVAEQTRCAR